MTTKLQFLDSRLANGSHWMISWFFGAAWLVLPPVIKRIYNQAIKSEYPQVRFLLSGPRKPWKTITRKSGWSSQLIPADCQDFVSKWHWTYIANSIKALAGRRSCHGRSHEITIGVNHGHTPSTTLVTCTHRCHESTTGKHQGYAEKITISRVHLYWWPFRRSAIRTQWTQLKEFLSVKKASASAAPATAGAAAIPSGPRPRWGLKKGGFASLHWQQWQKSGWNLAVLNYFLHLSTRCY